MAYEDLDRALAGPNKDGSPARVAKSLNDLKEALGDAFEGLLALSKEIAAPMLASPKDFEDPGYPSPPWDLIREHGILGMFESTESSFYFVWKSGDMFEVQCYMASGNGGYGGHTFSRGEDGTWHDLEMIGWDEDCDFDDDADEEEDDGQS